MTRLLRALRRSADRYGAAVTIESLSETTWESATFSGAVHRIAIGADASAARDAWLRALPEIDLFVPGHIVADAVVTERSAKGCILEVQTIAE